MARFLLLVSAGVGLLAGSVHAAAASDVVVRSGPNRVALIELYTSEGCSSCPPAEKWLGELRDDAGLWRNFVPVAFHVNYWDHLGWRDVLASRAFTDREYAYAKAWRASSVYTPCFVRNGAEWRPSGRAGEGISTKEAGTLVLTWQIDTNTCRVRFTPPVDDAKTTGFDLSVALLGGGIVSQVRRGENAGRELRHEFVALRLETAALLRSEDGGWTASVVVPPRAEIATKRRAIAAWITAHGKLEPLQAAGGWIE